MEGIGRAGALNEGRWRRGRPKTKATTRLLPTPPPATPTIVPSSVMMPLEMPICPAPVPWLRTETISSASKLADHFLAGFRVLDNSANLELFMERNAGMMVLFALALAGEADDGFLSTQPVLVSISALAGRFGVSRACAQALA